MTTISVANLEHTSQDELEMSVFNESALAWVRDCTEGTTVDKGDRLEQFTRLIAVPSRFLAATNVVWLGRRRDELTGRQHRADIAFDLHGERYFVQCKNQLAPLGEHDAEAYIAGFRRRRESGYTKLMLVVPAGVSAPAAAALYDAGAIVWTRDELGQVDVPLDQLQAAIAADLPAPASVVRKSPFPYNEQAIDALVALTDDRHLVYRATGTGKTVVQQHVIERLGSLSTIVLVPSIELARQNAAAYAAHLPSHRLLVAFSGDLNSNLVSFGVEATTNPDHVTEFLAKAGPHILVTTYQSVANAVMPAHHTFDLGIFDEAHRTARADSSLFNLALSDDNVKITRRDFYTATPRTLDFRLKASIKALGSDPDRGVALTPHSMDDPMLYGSVLEGAKLTLTQAIEVGAVTKFDLIAGVLDDPTLRRTIYDLRGGRQLHHYTNIWSDDPGNPDHYVTHEDVAQALFFLKQTKLGESYLTFHNSVERAHRTRKLLAALAADLGVNLKVLSVSAESSRDERDDALDLLSQENPAAVHVVCNCQLFVEGVDTPALDGVAFFDPRNSTVGVGQAIGRALRCAPGKTRAKVILPIFADDDGSAETWVRSSRYGNLYSIAAALRDLDVILADIIVEHHAGAQPINSRTIDNAVGVYVSLPESYDQPGLIKALRAVVLAGRLNALDLDELQRHVERRAGTFIGVENAHNGRSRQKLIRVGCHVGHDLGLHEPGQLAAGQGPFRCYDCLTAELLEHGERIGATFVGWETVQRPGRTKQRHTRWHCARGHDLGVHATSKVLKQSGLRCEACTDDALREAVAARPGFAVDQVERTCKTTVVHIICPAGHHLVRRNSSGLLRKPYQAIRCDDCFDLEVRQLVTKRGGVFIAKESGAIVVRCCNGHDLGTWQVSNLRSTNAPFRCARCQLEDAKQHAADIGGAAVTGLTRRGPLRAVELQCPEGHRLDPIPLGAFLQRVSPLVCDTCQPDEDHQNALRIGLRLIRRSKRGWSATCHEGHDAAHWWTARLASKQEPHHCPECFRMELEQLASSKGATMEGRAPDGQLILRCAAGHLIGNRSVSNLRSAKGAVRCEECWQSRVRRDVERCGGVFDGFVSNENGQRDAVVVCGRGHPIQTVQVPSLRKRTKRFLCPTCYELEMREHVERRGSVFMGVTNNVNGAGRRQVRVACPRGHDLGEWNPNEVRRGTDPLWCESCFLDKVTGWVETAGGHFGGMVQGGKQQRVRVLCANGHELGVALPDNVRKRKVPYRCTTCPTN
jgi:superfamily II DNA or RNA helicase